jgi:hypothetical protein
VRRLITMVLTCGLLMGTALALEPQDQPAVTGAGVYLRRPGERPILIDYDPEGRLLEGVPPGSHLYFVIDHATIAGHVAGYSAYLRLKRGEEALEGPALIRYLELFGPNGQSHGYRYTVQLSFAEGSYDTPPIVEGTVRIATKVSQKVEEFAFLATVQEGPVEPLVGEIWCEPDAGLVSFSHEDDHIHLHFGEQAEFFVRTGRQGPLNLDYSTHYHHSLAARYPEGRFSSIGFLAQPVFDNVGELRLYLPESTYIYQQTARGLSSPSYTYNAEAGCFVLTTRRLGIYIFSSIALPQQELAPIKPNPPTGGFL